MRDQRIRWEYFERIRARKISTKSPPITPAPAPAPIISDNEQSIDSDYRHHDKQHLELEGDGWIDHPDLLEEYADEPVMPFAPPQDAPVNAPEGDPAVVPEGTPAIILEGDNSSDSGQAVFLHTHHYHYCREYGSPK